MVIICSFGMFVLQLPANTRTRDESEDVRGQKNMDEELLTAVESIVSK